MFVLEFDPASGATDPCSASTPLETAVRNNIPGNAMLILDGSTSDGLIDTARHNIGSAWGYDGGTTAGPQINDLSEDLPDGTYTAMLRTSSVTPQRTFTLTFTLAGVPGSAMDPYDFMVNDISLVETTA